MDKNAMRLICNRMALLVVNPWGVEPQSKEPESFILSIELRVQKRFAGQSYKIFGCNTTVGDG